MNRYRRFQLVRIAAEQRSRSPESKDSHPSHNPAIARRDRRGQVCPGCGAHRLTPLVTFRKVKCQYYCGPKGRRRNPGITVIACGVSMNIVNYGSTSRYTHAY